MLLNLLIAILTRAFDHATNDLGQVKLTLIIQA